MKFTAKQIAQMLEGRVEGNENVIVSKLCKIEEGEKEGLSFLANPKYAHYLYSTQSSIVLVNADFVLEQPVSATLVRVANAYEAVARLLTLYESMTQRRKGIHPLAFVSPTAKVGEDVYIGPFAVIGDNVTVGSRTQVYANTTIEEGAAVGEDCILYPHVSIYHGCRIGNGVILHSGVVIGADGFGFAPSEEGYEKIPQIGIVTIEDNVEIGANACVDRSTMGSTYVRRGVKLDNLVQIAHNCEVGAHTVMSAQVGVAGSTKVGEWCMFGGQVGVAGHINVAPRTHAGAQSGIVSQKKLGATVMGSPAMDFRQWQKSSIYVKRLPDMAEELKRMQKQIDALNARIEELTK